MNRVTQPQIDRLARLAPAAQAACAPVLVACPATLFVGMSGSAFSAAGTMYEVAFQAARRQVERELILARAARLN